MSINSIKKSLRLTQHWQRFTMAILLLLSALGYSSQSSAVIVAGSCSMSNMTGTGYIISPPPAQMYNGFVAAKQFVVVDFTYRKTGTNNDTLLNGAWYSSAMGLGPFSTVAVQSSTGKNIPGLGFRLTNAATGSPADQTAFNTLNTRTVNQAGTFTILETFAIEFVVTDANLYVGGSPISFSGGMVSIVFGNLDTWIQKNATQAGTRCVAAEFVLDIDFLTLGGVPLPELPPPTLPTCTLGAKEILVPLDPVDASQLKATGKTAGTTGFTIPLGTCGKDAKPYITLTDSANLGNRTSDLTLAPSSTAKGVRIRLTKGDGSGLQLGAQNTSVSSNNVGQFLVGTSPADNTPMSIKLNAAYVRTDGDIEAGSVKADAIFTVAYP